MTNFENFDIKIDFEDCGYRNPRDFFLKLDNFTFLFRVGFTQTTYL